MDLSGIDELRSAFEQQDRHELDAVALLSGARGESSDVECTIQIFGGNKVRSTWLAEFGGVVENRLVIGDWFMPEAHTTHPLLLDHCEDRMELYFSAPPINVDQVRSALLRAHGTVFGEWRPPSRYLNPNMPIDDLLSGGRGQLASGPASLIQTMADMSASYLHTNTLAKGEPTIWNPRAAAFEDVGEVVLFLGEQTWDQYPSPPQHRSYVTAASCSITPQ